MRKEFADTKIHPELPSINYINEYYRVSTLIIKTTKFGLKWVGPYETMKGNNISNELCINT